MSDAAEGAAGGVGDDARAAPADEDEEGEPREAGTRRWPTMGVVLAVLWLFVRGVPLDPAYVLGEFLIGLAVGFPIAYLLRRMYPKGIEGRALLTAIPPATVYVALFLKELIIANLDVARRVLAPSMPLDPAVIEIPLRVRSDAAVTTIANSITLTPGTLTMDYDADRNAVYVHSIYAPDPDAVVAPIRDWEDYALRIFDEDAAPDDTAPAPTIHEEAGAFDARFDETGERVTTTEGPADGRSGDDVDGHEGSLPETADERSLATTDEGSPDERSEEDAGEAPDADAESTPEDGNAHRGEGGDGDGE